MAVLSVDEIRKSRSGGLDSQWHRTYRRAWRVVTDGPYAIGALGARLSIPVFFVVTEGWVLWALGPVLAGLLRRRHRQQRRKPEAASARPPRRPGDS